MLPVRAIISPAMLVEALWNMIRLRIDPPTVVRMNQPIYALRGRNDGSDLLTARYSTLRDLDQLVPACAAMHREEVGIDPAGARCRRLSRTDPRSGRKETLGDPRGRRRDRPPRANTRP